VGADRPVDPEKQSVSDVSMTGALMIRWTGVVRGREGKALEVYGRALELYEGLAEEGRLSGHRDYLAVTGQGGGFVLVEGPLAELLALVASPNHLRIRDEAAAVLDDVEMQIFAGGSDRTAEEMLQSYAAGLADLGYL
jgi:hypothetical protein